MEHESFSELIKELHSYRGNVYPEEVSGLVSRVENIECVIQTIECVIQTMLEKLRDIHDD